MVWVILLAGSLVGSLFSAEHAEPSSQLDPIEANGYTIGYSKFVQVSLPYSRTTFYDHSQKILGVLYQAGNANSFMCHNEQEPWVAAAVLKVWRPSMKIEIKVPKKAGGV